MRVGRVLVVVVLLSAATSAQDLASAPPESRGDLILVVGAGGTPEFERNFRDWAQHWQTAATQGRLLVQVIGLEAGDISATDRDRLQRALQAASVETTRPLWVVCLGHGSFDGRTSKFNLRGPDVSSQDLGTWLQPLQRPVALIATHAASGPLLEVAGGPQRVIITATKSAAEVNYSRFGGWLILALQDPTADLDKDQQVSLLEGFLRASRRTREFYESDGRLETEHPLLDDNGDGQGVRATSFAGVTALGEPQPGQTVDGARAHQWQLIPSTEELQLDPETIRRRDELELQLVALKSRKASLDEAAYYAQLEELLLQIAELTLPQ